MSNASYRSHWQVKQLKITSIVNLNILKELPNLTLSGGIHEHNARVRNNLHSYGKHSLKCNLSGGCKVFPNKVSNKCLENFQNWFIANLLHSLLGFLSMNNQNTNRNILTNNLNQKLLSVMYVLIVFSYCYVLGEKVKCQPV